MREYARSRLKMMASFLMIAATTLTCSAKTIQLSQCGALKRGGSTYVLQNDVVAEGTCFSVQDSNITLDLNGHTITYATADRTGRRHGILGTACYGPHLDKNPCGGEFNDFTVRNGKIVQGPAAVPYSDAIRIGQGGGRNLTVTGVEIEISGESAKAISTAYARGGQKIFGNTIRSSVKKIGSRHQLDGVTIKLESDGNGAPSEVYDNRIQGSAQGGVLVTAPRSRVYGNKIALSSYYTNDFCVYAWAPKTEVYNNTCDSTNGTDSGRGIHLSGEGILIHHNKIRVRELRRNQEYSGCEVGGAYGIQLEGKTNTSEVYSNDITAIAEECDAVGLRATELKPTATNIARDNTITAIKQGAGKGIAAGFSASNPKGGLTIQGNTFVTDGPAIMLGWDGASGIQWIDNLFSIGPHGKASDWSLFTFKNGIPSTGLVMQDARFSNGASMRIKGIPLEFNKWGAQIEVLVRWTAEITVRDQANAPISTAKVRVLDNTQSPVDEVAVDRTGMARVALTQERRFNSKAGMEREDLGPYTLLISAPGFRSSTLKLSPSQKVQREVVLTAGANAAE